MPRVATLRGRRGRPRKWQRTGYSGSSVTTTSTDFDKSSRASTSIETPPSMVFSIFSTQAEDEHSVSGGLDPQVANLVYEQKHTTVPGPWQIPLKELLESSGCFDPQRIQPFREGIFSGRLQPLTRSFEGSQPTNHVNINIPSIWKNHDFLSSSPQKNKIKIERELLFGAGSAELHYANGSAMPIDALNIIQSYYHPHEPTVPLCFAFAIDVPELRNPPPEPLVSQQHLYSDEYRFTANYTPEGVMVDLHTDNGMAGNAFHGEGPKLWVFYPPTEQNVNLHNSVTSDSGLKYVQLEKSLSDGVYVVVFSSETVYIPSGWIHATFALRSGFLQGTSWCAAEDVLIAAQGLSCEIRNSQTETLSGIGPFLHCLAAASRNLASSENRKAHDLFMVTNEALATICSTVLGGKSLGDALKKQKGGITELRRLCKDIRRDLKKARLDWSSEKCSCPGLLSHLP